MIFYSKKGESKGKNKKPILLISILACLSLFLIALNSSSAATTTTNTTLGITAGSFSFTKDTSSTMDSYFSHSPSTSANIDIGSYSANIIPISASSTDNHRFTVSDLLGNSFIVTIQSSALTIDGANIPASAIGYTGTSWLGTGRTLTAAPTSAVDIGTAPVTFVARNDNSGLSVFSQEISLKVNIPAAQTPGNYTGVITFTY